MYTAVEDWVTDYFLPMFRRTLGGEFRWCAPVVAARRGDQPARPALWHAWEVLRLQPGTGIATWYRDHLDHQLPILMGARGPFYQCSETAHREPREAAVMPAPDDWWDTDEPRMPVRQAAGQPQARSSMGSPSHRMTACHSHRAAMQKAVATMRNAQPTSLDPAHILAVCARSTGGRRGLAVRQSDGIVVCLMPSRRTAPGPASPWPASATRSPACRPAAAGTC